MAILAHETLYNAGILHGDISENNVIIDLSTDNDGVSTRRGLLIDLDMARFIGQDELQPAEAVDDLGTFPGSDESNFEATPDAEANSSLGSNSGQRPKSLPDITVSGHVNLFLA